MYSAWRISYQDSEQAARAAYNEVVFLRQQLKSMTSYADKRNLQALDLQQQLNIVIKERDELVETLKHCEQSSKK